MNKNELISFLNEHFNEILINDKFKNPINLEEIKLWLGDQNKLDQECIISVADIIVKTNNNQFLYFLYYSQKDTTMIYDEVKKCINVKMKNNVMKRYQYDSIIKRVKKNINKSNSYLIFFSCSNIEFNGNLKSHILVLNEQNINQYLNQKYDV